MVLGLLAAPGVITALIYLFLFVIGGAILLLGWANNLIVGAVFIFLAFMLLKIGGQGLVLSEKKGIPAMMVLIALGLAGWGVNTIAPGTLFSVGGSVIAQPTPVASIFDWIPLSQTVWGGLPFWVQFVLIGLIVYTAVYYKKDILKSLKKVKRSF